jgi:hypothetical protein
LDITQKGFKALSLGGDTASIMQIEVLRCCSGQGSIGIDTHPHEGGWAQITDDVSGFGPPLLDPFNGVVAITL